VSRVVPDGIALTSAEEAGAVAAVIESDSPDEEDPLDGIDVIVGLEATVGIVTVLAKLAVEGAMLMLVPEI
jgi:hypothetical protein